MSFTGKTKANVYKDILHMDNSNAGISTSLQVVKDGAGNQSCVYISDDQMKVKPENDDTTTLIDIQNKAGTTLFQVDSVNSLLKALGHNLNTHYANFGIDASVGSLSYLANTHYAIPYNSTSMKSTDADVDFGTGTDPDTSFTTANVTSQYASQIVPMMWYVSDNITIDSVSHIEGADAASGDTTRMHLYSYTFTSGSTSCLTSGTLLAHNSDITNGGNEQAYLSTWTIDSSDVDSGRVILCFFRSDTINSDYTLNVTVKYHLR